MRDTIRIQMGQRVAATLPKALRDRYQLWLGDELALLDLGGIFVLGSIRSEIDSLAEQLSVSLTQKGETLESMLAVLREERERYEG